MKTRILFVLIAGFLLGGAVVQAEKKKTDADLLKGNWVVSEAKDMKLLGAKFTFGDGKGSVKTTRDEPFTFKLDPSKKPKEMDIFP